MLKVDRPFVMRHDGHVNHSVDEVPFGYTVGNNPFGMEDIDPIDEAFEGTLRTYKDKSYLQAQYFVQGMLRLKVLKLPQDSECPKHFTWTIWASISKPAYEMLMKSWSEDKDDEEEEEEEESDEDKDKGDSDEKESMFGTEFRCWCQSDIPGYQSTVHLKMIGLNVKKGVVLFKFADDFNQIAHTIVREKEKGVKLQRVLDLYDLVTRSYEEELDGTVDVDAYNWVKIA